MVPETHNLLSFGERRDPVTALAVTADHVMNLSAVPRAPLPVDDGFASAGSPGSCLTASAAVACDEGAAPSRLVNLRRCALREPETWRVVDVCHVFG